MESPQNSEISFGDLLGLDNGFVLEETTSTAAPAEFVATLEPEEKTGEEEQEKGEGEGAPGEPEKKPEPKKEEEKVIEDKPVVEAPVFLNMAKKLLDSGKWQDVLIEVDGKEVKLSEIDNLDEETYFEISEAQNSIRDEEIEQNYVSVKDLDENKKKLINILKNGGDLKEIFQNESQLKRPFEGVDLTKETTQMSIVYQQYIRQGLSEGEAKDLTEKAKKEMTLDVKTDSIVKYYQENFDKTLAEKEKEVLASKQAEEVAIKEYRKELSTIYKSEGVTESVSKRLVDAATKKDDTGNLVIDGIYEKMMQDPKEAKELIFFMLERDNYLKTKGATIKKNEQLDLMRKVSIIRQNSGKVTPKQEEVPDQPTTAFGQIVLE